MQGISGCAATEQLRIPLILPDLRTDWGLSQSTEAGSTDQKGPCKILAVDVITPATHLSEVEQCAFIILKLTPLGVLVRRTVAT